MSDHLPFVLPHLVYHMSPCLLSSGRRLGAVTSAKPITCVPGEIGGEGGAVVFASGSLPALSSLRHRHLIQKPGSFISGGHLALLGVGLACKCIKG